ncbi:MAG: type II toxin-antitoxin system Phd/YefM family antitoxin [Pseudonocardiaceae bacterium]
MTKTVPVKDLRQALGPLLDEVSDRREHIVITRHGRPAAVIIPHDEYTALEETADVLSDPGAMAALAEGLDADAVDDVTLDELRTEIARKRAVG